MLPGVESPPSARGEELAPAAKCALASSDCSRNFSKDCNLDMSGILARTAALRSFAISSCCLNKKFARPASSSYLPSRHEWTMVQVVVSSVRTHQNKTSVLASGFSLYLRNERGTSDRQGRATKPKQPRQGCQGQTRRAGVAGKAGTQHKMHKKSYTNLHLDQSQRRPLYRMQCK